MKLKLDIVVWGLMVSMMIIGGMYSLVAPFYPKEAEKRGMASTEIGFVFSVFNFSGFLFSVPLGLSLNKIGVKVMLIGSMVTLFVSNLSFGLLNYTGGYTAFFTMSLILRITEAIGQNGVNVSVYAVINEFYKEQSFYLIGLTEMYYALGIVLAPLLGSVLYTAGGGETDAPFGYNLPFLFAALIILVSAVVLYLKVPSKFENETVEVTRVCSKWVILTVPGIWAGFFAAGSANLGLATFSAMLEPHLRRNFQLSTIKIGLLFLLNGTGYCFMCPVSGKLCDRGCNPGNLMIIGTIIAAIGSLLIGPVKWISETPSLYFIITGLSLHGFGLGMIPMPAYLYMKKQFSSSEFEHIVSGLFLTGFFLGGSIGPTLGGYLYDYSDKNFGLVSYTVFVPYMCVSFGVLLLELNNVLSGNILRPRRVKREHKNSISEGDSIPYELTFDATAGQKRNHIDA